MHFNIHLLQSLFSTVLQCFVLFPTSAPLHMIHTLSDLQDCWNYFYDLILTEWSPFCSTSLLHSCLFLYFHPFLCHMFHELYLSMVHPSIFSSSYFSVRALRRGLVVNAQLSGSFALSLNADYMGTQIDKTCFHYPVNNPFKTVQCYAHNAPGDKDHQLDFISICAAVSVAYMNLHAWLYTSSTV